MRLLARRPRLKRKKSSLLSHMVRDPLQSLSRIVGQGGADLPFVEDETEKLSAAAFSDVFGEAGLDPVVAMAFAKVVVEAYSPQEIYQPLWIAFGRSGDVDLGELRKMDWSPLRSLFPELSQATRPIHKPVQKPRARPPVGRAPRGRTAPSGARRSRPSRLGSTPERTEATTVDQAAQTVSTQVNGAHPPTSAEDEATKTTPIARARPAKKKP